MKLNLVKPIIFFDLETTGTDFSKDRIVEICYIKVWPDGKEIEYTKRINPEMHIPEGASAVHGIYDADVKDCPTFKEVAREIANEFEGCDVAGFNSNRFDLPMLAEVCDAISVPVIASGGAGKIDDFITLFKTLPKVDAGLAASIFHFGEVSIQELKEVLGVEKFETIIIASGANFADALAGSYLATVKSAPILLDTAEQAERFGDLIGSEPAIHTGKHFIPELNFSGHHLGAHRASHLVAHIHHGRHIHI